MSFLSPQRELFAQEYVLTGVAAEAYRKAYPKSLQWKDVSVYAKSSALLADDKVQIRIKELQEKVQDRFDISAERLLLEQSRIALFDFRRLFDENGKLIQPRDMTDDVASAVASVKVSNYQRGDDMEEVITELKLWNKNTSLESLFKNKGLYEKDNKQNGIAEAAKELGKVLQGMIRPE